MPPYLLIHGDKDFNVPVEQSQLMCAAMKKAGASCELIVVAGGAHGRGSLEKAGGPGCLRAGHERLVEEGIAVTPSPLVARRTRRLPWPKRLDIATAWPSVALVIAYCDRVNISVAAPSMMREYGWDTAGMGWVLSGFFAGYALMMIPAGMLADRFGPKRVFAVAHGLVVGPDGAHPAAALALPRSPLRVFDGCRRERHVSLDERHPGAVVSAAGVFARDRLLLERRLCRLHRGRSARFADPGDTRMAGCASGSSPASA